MQNSDQEVLFIMVHFSGLLASRVILQLGTGKRSANVPHAAPRHALLCGADPPRPGDPHPSAVLQQAELQNKPLTNNIADHQALRHTNNLL